MQLSSVQVKASAQAFTAGLAAASGRAQGRAARAGQEAAADVPASRRLMAAPAGAGAVIRADGAAARAPAALTAGQAYAQLASGAAALLRAQASGAALGAPPAPAGGPGVCVAAALRRPADVGRLRVPLGCSGVDRPAQVGRVRAAYNRNVDTEHRPAPQIKSPAAVQNGLRRDGPLPRARARRAGAF